MAKSRIFFRPQAVRQRAQQRGGEKLAQGEYAQQKPQYGCPHRDARAEGNNAACLIKAQGRKNRYGKRQAGEVQKGGKCDDGKIAPVAFLFGHGSVSAHGSACRFPLNKPQCGSGSNEKDAFTILYQI